MITINLLFDIGGTNFKSLIIQEDGKMIEVFRVSTPNYLSNLTPVEINDAIISRILKTFMNFRANISAIGICFSGPVNDKGDILGSDVIYGQLLLEPFPLLSILKEKLSFNNVYILNDMASAAWRYINTYDAFCILTISSGIGNKIVLNGNIQVSSLGVEGEIGHIRAIGIDDVDIDCACGCGKNHINCIASGRGIELIANTLKNSKFSDEFSSSLLVNKKRITAEDIASAAEMQDIFAQKIIEYCSFPLAYALCVLLISLRIEKIVLIGGFIQNSQYYFKTLLNHVKKIGVYNQDEALLEMKFIIGHDDDYHGLIGINEYIKYSSQYTQIL